MSSITPNRTNATPTITTPAPGVGSTPTLAPPPKKKINRMKYKDQGLRASKSFFISPSKIHLYSDLPDDLMLTGTIISIPNKSKFRNDYTITWDSSALPDGFDVHDLRGTVAKGSVAFEDLKSARANYDVAFPGSAAPRQSKKSQKKPPPHPIHSDPRGNDKRILTATVMAPEIVPTPVEMSPPVIHGSCYEEASDSDDGSDLEEGDTYLPRDVDEDHSADKGEDKQDTNMGDLNFVYDELKEPLEEPADMYSGKGPCLRPGVATSFKTAFECVQLCGGMSKLFWRRLTRNSNEYAVRNIKKDGSFAGRPWKKSKLKR